MNLLKRMIVIFLAASGFILAGNIYTEGIFDMFCVNVEAASSGQCGDNVTYTLDDNGLLTIKGSGNMEDYKPWANWAPWYEDGSYNNIKNIVFEEGVTSILIAFKGEKLDKKY